MKKNAKKLLSLVLVLTLCFTMVACKSKTEKTNSDSKSTVDSTESSSSTESAESTESKEVTYDTPMEISIALWNIGDMVTDGDDAVRDAIYKKFNITIKPYAVTWGDYPEKIQLWAASNSLPDMTAYEAGFTQTYDDWTSQGVVRALPTDLSKYPNVKAQVEGAYGKSVNKITDSNTTNYAVPRPTYKDQTESMLDSGIAIRKDWMDTVGVTEVPDTLDKLIDLAKKFQTGDPDGNGKDDTIGITGYNYSWMSGLMMGDGENMINGFRWSYADNGDGSLIPVWMTQGGLAGFKAMKQAYDAGVLDPDYIIIKGEEGRDKFKNGVAGMYVHSGPSLAAIQNLEQGFAKTQKGKTIDQLITWAPIFANSKGEVNYYRTNSCWSETYLSSKVSDDKADRCLALLDYLLSDEGFQLCAYGIEGVDYTKDADGNITIIETKKADGTVEPISEKYPMSSLIQLANWSGYHSADSMAYTAASKKMMADYESAQLARGAKELVAPDTNGIFVVDNADLDTVGADYAKYTNDMMTSKDLDTAWKKWVDDETKAGYDKVIKEMNDKYKASGRK